MRIVVSRELSAEPIDGGLGGLALRERPVDPPYVKDYDQDGTAPETWPRQFDLSSWGFFLAREGSGPPVGAAAVAFRAAGVDMLEGRRDLGVLWDIRVHPAHGRRGIGAELFGSAASWLRARGAARLKVETQSVNVAACRFYRSQGCVLGAVSRHAYPEHPREAMLLWYLEL